MESVNYSIDVEQVAGSGGLQWMAEIFCNGQCLATGVGVSPIAAAADATDHAHKLNEELERLVG